MSNPSSVKRCGTIWSQDVSCSHSRGGIPAELGVRTAESLSMISEKFRKGARATDMEVVFAFVQMEPSLTSKLGIAWWHEYVLNL